MNFQGNNEYNDGFSYDNWGGYNLLVKLNQHNPAVRKYLLDVVKYWVSEFDVDGIRLDAADVLDFGFMHELRMLANEIKPEFWLMGEVIHGDYSRWVNSDMLHSVTNYQLYKALYSGHNEHNYFEIAHTVRYLLDKGNLPYHLYNFVDNHDVERIASQLVHKEHLSLIYTMLFTMPGIPCLYYGSEWGIEGKKNWNDTELRPEISHLEWNALTDHIQKLISIKHEHDALHQCDYQQIYLTNTACIYQMKSEKETLWICINMNPDNVEVPIDYRGQANNLLTQSQVDINGVLYLEPNSSMILQI